MAKSKSGGGITGKNVRQVKVRTGGPNRKANPGGVAQIGYSYGEHVTDRRESSGYRGEPLFKGPALQSKLGNEIAASTKAGPGGSREVHYCGSQQSLPPARPMAKGRDTLAEFGRDSAIVRTRR